MRLAVVLIDMQGYFVNKLAPHDQERIIPRQIEVLEWCKKNSVPVLVITTKKEFRGPNIPAIVGALEGVLHYNIDKICDLAIYSECEFTTIFRELGVTHLYFMGINSYVCVQINVANAQFHLRCPVMISPDVIAGPIGGSDALPYYREVCNPYFESVQEFFAWANAFLGASS